MTVHFIKVFGELITFVVVPYGCSSCRETKTRRQKNVFFYVILCVQCGRILCLHEFLKISRKSRHILKLIRDSCCSLSEKCIFAEGVFRTESYFHLSIETFKGFVTDTICIAVSQA
jgi:hypothetical protein